MLDLIGEIGKMIEVTTMSIYDNVGEKRVKSGVYLTKHQKDKLQHIEELFGITAQRFWSDALDFFYCHYLDITSGRVSLSTSLKQATMELLDDYIKLKDIKGLKRPTYERRRRENRISHADSNNDRGV